MTEHEQKALEHTVVLTTLRRDFQPVLNSLASLTESWFGKVQGFDQSSKSEMIALEHSELSERLEAVRHKDLENEAEEVADAFTRLLHYCGKYKIDLGEEFFNKMIENFRRPSKHGKEF